MKSYFSRAFTLIEVNMAIMVMSAGILSIVILYSMGFRESRQCREDVASATYAEAVLSRLVAATTATNLRWSVFRNISNYPRGGEGWSAYFDSNADLGSNPDALARQAFSAYVTELKRAGLDPSLTGDLSYPSSASAGMSGGLIIMHNQDAALVRFGFRAMSQDGEFLGAPVYYTEARFMGVVDE